MTLDEAIGIKSEMRDAKTGEYVDLSERCRRAIEFLGGLDEVVKFIPFPVDTLREKLKEDPHLNNTSLSTWDKAAGFKCSTIAYWCVAASGSCMRSTALRLPAALMASAFSRRQSGCWWNRRRLTNKTRMPSGGPELFPSRMHITE